MLSSFPVLLLPGTEVLIGNKDLDARKDNAPNLCPALTLGAWEALRKFHEILLFIVLDKC